MVKRQILINKRQVESRKVYHSIKRIIDLIISILALILLTPIMAIIAYKIKKEDGGPIFYSQIRVGKNGKKFKMLKFRSMIINADQKLDKLMKLNEVDGAMFKMKHDPRVTKVGHFLRKHSLDELPQLINVLKGDMSLVGPRPPLPSEVKKYTDYDKQRLYVTPGCTGLWQATERNNVGFNEMVELDLSYIKNESMLLDIKIILMTIQIIFWPNSSY